MQKKDGELLIFKSLTILVISAFLAAISIVCGKYLAIRGGDVMRFSFENMPILMAGMLFGPLVGAVVGVVADLIGCVLVGYTVNPLVTVGAAAIGLVGGAVYHILGKIKGCPYVLKISVTVGSAHLIGSVIIKTVGLAAFYDMPLGILMLWRLLNYLIVGVLEGVILWYLLKNKALLREINSILSKTRKNKTAEKFMNYSEAIEYIHSVNWTFCKPGLERIGELCERLGNPQNKLKFIHVAGTNGKGSFCSMLESVLRAAGYKTGLYTSPYIKEFNERMRVMGENIENDTLADITSRIRPIADSMADKPTEFELITAIAFQYFYEAGCDVVVLEAGMGGRLDSTNIIREPYLSVITGIALDHVDYLGDTVEKIAAEKAGIIKDKSPILYGGEDASAGEVIKAVANERGSEFFDIDYSDIKNLNSTLEGTTYDFGENKDIKISLLGLYQPKNSALVVKAVRILRERGLKISDKALYDGLASAKWIARFEILSKEPLIIFDGAHNPQGISSAVMSIKHYFADEKVYVLTGVLRDKDYKFIAGELSKVAERAFTLTPQSPRALSAEDYARVLCEAGTPATPHPSIEAALLAAKAAAKKDGKPLICLGSLYTYCDIIKYV